MRILLLNYEYPPLGGGGGVASRKLAEEWVRQGHSVDVVTTYFTGLASYEKINGVEVHRVQVPGRKDWNTATFLSLMSFPFIIRKKIEALFTRKKFDIINTHFAVPTGPAGVWASRKYKVPNILSLHGGDIYDPTKKTSPHRFFFLRNYVRKILEKSTVLVAQSKNTRDNTSRIYHYYKEIPIIPLGFKPVKIPNISCSQMGLSSDLFYLIGIGRMVRRKGFEYLIQALEGLPENIHLLLLGDGPLLGKLKTLSFRLGLEKRILFTGRVDDEKKYGYLKNANLYVLSSIHEGYGIVLQEAMEAGLPIVSTNCGGQTDFLKEGENALLVNPANPKELRQAIRKLYEDSGLRKAIAERNRDEIKNYYIENIARQYLEIFRQYLS